MAEAPVRQQLTAEERARISPAGLARLAVPHWKLLPITDLINRVFISVAMASLKPDDPELDRWRRVILAVPPRSGKSELCSIAGAAWYLGHAPDNHIAVLSYAAENAERFGGSARNVLQGFGAPIFGIVTDPSTEAKNEWGTLDYGAGRARRGGMYAMGLDGQAIGKGFNIAVIDDPFKQMPSASEREHAKEVWQSVIKNRLEPGGAALIVMQRWHEDDLAAYVMREEGLFEDVGRGGWNPIIVPLRAEKITNEHIPGLGDRERPDPLGREPGQLLQTRYSLQELEDRERTTPEIFWNAQFQQRPSAAEGVLFRRDALRYFDILPDYYRLYKTGQNWLVPRNDVMAFMTVDLASSLEKGADYFCVGLWAATKQRDLLLLDVVRGRYEGPDQDSILEGMYTLSSPRPAFVAIEDASYQLTMIQRMRRRGMAVRRLRADRNKYARATVAATRFNMEGVFLPAAPKPWKTDAIHDLLSFPHAAHDDVVDMVAYACIQIEPRNSIGTASIRLIG